MRKLLFLLIAFVTPLFALDSRALIEKINSNFSSIKTIKASVEQKVIMNGKEYLYSGYYVAKWPGKVRVTYSYPDRYILWIDDKGVFNWYVPRLKVLYYFEGYTSTTGNNPSGVMPVIPDSRSTFKDISLYNISPLSTAGFLFFKRYYFFRLTPRPGYEDLPEMEVYVYKKYPVPYKIVGKRHGKQVFVQEMKNVKLINGIYFPEFIKVKMEKQKLITETRYKNVILNQNVSEKEVLYEPPPGVKRLNLLQMLRK